MTWWWLYRLEIRQNAFLWSTIPQKPLLTMMNCFCGMADRWKAFSLISSRDNCQRSWPSRISDMPRVVFELVQDLSSGFIEWSDWTKEMTTSVFVHCCVLYAPQVDIHGSLGEIFSKALLQFSICSWKLICR